MQQTFHWIRGLLPLILLGLLSIALASCSDDDSFSSKFGVGTVTGVITDDYNVPLSGVTVVLDDSIAPGATNTVTTDAQGQFTMDNVSMGKNVLIFTKQDYQTMSVTVTPKSFTDGKAIINASMEYAAAKIRGTVLDAQHGNQPLAGASVAVNGVVKTTTGQDGTFLVSNLPLNNYTVTVAKSGYTTITRSLTIDDFVDGTATVDVTMGGREILRGCTLEDILAGDHWYYNEYRGGRNSQSYPHWDWSTDYMATFKFWGNWEEQNEGTTLRIRNDKDQQSNPADLDVFDSYTYGIKHITADNCMMTIQCRTHNSSASNPAVWGVQVVDLSENDPQTVKVGDNRTLGQENYSDEVFDLSPYIGKDIVIAIGIYRAQKGDYWHQFVMRRLAFYKDGISGWDWLPGTKINDELADWHITQEMVRSTNVQTKWSFSGISPQRGNRDNYQGAYQSWRDVAHIGAEWCFVPVNKDTEPFAGEGFVMKTRGGGTPVNTTTPQAYFYSKFAIQDGHSNFVLRCRNFSGRNPTYFKLTVIDEDMNVKHIAPSKVSAKQWANAENGCVKFIHEDGGAGNPEAYATFSFDLSELKGKNVVLCLGVFKGENNGDENKLCIYSININ